MTSLARQVCICDPNVSSIYNRHFSTDFEPIHKWFRGRDAGSRIDKNSNGCRGIPKLPRPACSLWLFPPSINPSGNISPLVTPLPSSWYGLASSEPKHPKSWAATPCAKRRSKEAIHTVVYFDWSLIEARPQGIKKVVSSLKSARIEEIQRAQERTVSKDRNTEST